MIMIFLLTVFVNVYAFTGDRLSQRQLRDYVEDVRKKVLTLPDAGKVNLVGAQDEVIYLGFSTRQIAALGPTQKLVVDTLSTQNAITPSGVIEADGERVSVRVSGAFASEGNLRQLNLRIDGKFFRLSDIATIRRGTVDPPQPLFRYRGAAAIGLAIVPGRRPICNSGCLGAIRHRARRAARRTSVRSCARALSEASLINSARGLDQPGGTSAREAGLCELSHRRGSSRQRDVHR